MQAIAAYRQVNEKTTQRRRHRILHMGAGRASAALPCAAPMLATARAVAQRQVQCRACAARLAHEAELRSGLAPFSCGLRTVVFLVLGLSAILLNKSLHGKGWTPHTYHACAGAAALTGVVL